MLSGFPHLHDRVGAELFDEGIAHIRKRGLAVRMELMLHFGHVAPNHFLFIVGKRQRLRHRLVALHQLGRGEARRNVNPLGVVLYHVGDGMNRAVHGAGAEILPAGKAPVARRVDGDLN